MESLRKPFVLGCCLAIAGCAAQGPGGMLPGQLGPQEVRHATSGGNPAIYVFQGPPDAASPLVGLINIGKTLYGTTAAGGTDNIGALYSITTAGSETVMHSFTGSPDGEYPEAALTNVSGTLYGSTYYGGTTGHGTIFSIAPSGSYKILYNCDSDSASDCTEPDSAMIYVASKKTLYGTGYRCGSGGDGCIFEFNLAAKKPKARVLYSFSGSASSPGNPSGVIFYRNALYGTTQEGGTNGYGTVFKVTLAGKESILYSFKAHPDGAHPEAPLLAVGNLLYGTTYQGGNQECGDYAGCGVVFKITPSGKEKVMYTFTDVASKHDAQHPQSALIDVGGALYGTTPDSTYGSGTVYSVSPSGHESLVTDFELPSSDPPGWPEAPYAPLLSLGGKLYGTSYGSSGSNTYGTVFAL